jgi:hypothetical protein
MTPQSLHDVFLASASTAGALIGLLFVAVSIAHDRLSAQDAGLIHRIRASAALTAFTNALTISLFALLPDGSLGPVSIVVGLLGLTFIGGSVLSIVRHSRGVRWRDLTFLLILSSVCAQQVVAGALFQHSHHLSDAEWLAILVIACFLIGIQRAWELIGGPDIGLSGEVIELIRDRQAAADEAVADARSPAELAPPPGETSVESPQRSASPQGS